MRAGNRQTRSFATKRPYCRLHGQNLRQVSEKRDNYCISAVIAFRYGSFWDVPRSILLRYRGKVLLLESHFDETLDEYPDHYTVYELPTGTEAAIRLVGICRRGQAGLWLLPSVPLTRY